MSIENRSCPCLYLEEPCNKHCTCKNHFSSYDCDNCCSYGNDEQRKKKALHLSKMRETCYTRGKVIQHQDLIIKRLENEKFTESWLSPIESERQDQIDKLKKLWPNFPNESPLWQYMNGLLEFALRYQYLQR